MSTKVRNQQFLPGSYEIKAKDDGKRTFEGILSTSHIDLGDGWRRDIVHPGAFKRTLDHFRSAKEAHIPLVDTHNYRSFLNTYGHMLDGEEMLTGKTLRYELKNGGVLDVAEMKLNTQWQVIDGPDGERVLDRLRPGSVRKMSMGYETIQGDEAELKEFGPSRNLREVSLNEGSLVTFAMNPNAEVDPATVKAMFDTLRDGTLTPEQEEEIKSWPAAARERFRALLDPPPAAPAPEEGPAHYAHQDSLKLKLLMLGLRRPARALG